jgi:Spy/CpxP family protein refolding chaperone
MTRKLWSSIAVIAVAAAVAIPVVAQSRQGRGGPGRGVFGGPPLFVRGLNLTEAQREQIRTLTEERRNQAGNPGRSIAELDHQLRLTRLADTPDLQTVEELKTAIAAAMAEQLSARIELESRIAQVLTPEQRAQARESLGTAGARRGPPLGGGRGRTKI